MKILSCLPLAAALSLATLTPGVVLASPSPMQPVVAKSIHAAQPVEIARRGADDAKTHDKNDDHGRRGRDGGKGRGRGRDDGDRRNSLNESAPVQIHLARHGADDRKGDDRGGKGRGRGRDDGPRHS